MGVCVKVTVLKKGIYHAGLSLLSIIQQALRVGLVRGPTFNFMLLKQEKGRRTKEERLMQWASLLHSLYRQSGGAGTNPPLLSTTGRLA